MSDALSGYIVWMRWRVEQARKLRTRIAQMPTQQEIDAMHRLVRLEQAAHPSPTGAPVKPMPSPPNSPKRTGLTRVLNAVKAQGDADVAWDGLAQRVERNNARQKALAELGNAAEQAKEHLMDQIQLEQQLDEMSAALGSNGAPGGPLSDTTEPSPGQQQGSGS